MAWIKYTGRTQLPGIPDSGEPTMSDRPEIPLAPLADLQRRVEALPDASTASVRDAMPIATICYVCAAAVLAAMWRL